MFTVTSPLHWGQGRVDRAGGGGLEEGELDMGGRRMEAPPKTKHTTVVCTSALCSPMLNSNQTMDEANFSPRNPSGKKTYSGAA